MLRLSALLFAWISSQFRVCVGRQWSLFKQYDATNFFDAFDFFTEADPTHGAVQYVDDFRLYNNKSGTIYLGVDSDSAETGAVRSLRAEMKDHYTDGLYVLDLLHQPTTNDGTGCSVWPAYWMYNRRPGNQWPKGGEIDMLEGANDMGMNQVSLHTTWFCNMDGLAGGEYSSLCGSSQCNVFAEGSGSGGCSLCTNWDTSTFGSELNKKGGGYLVTEVDTSRHIRQWWIVRDGDKALIEIVKQSKVKTEDLGTPHYEFPLGENCNGPSHFYDLSVVFNIDFCGDWAGDVQSYQGCVSEDAPICEAYVSDLGPDQYQAAYWEFYDLRVFQ